MLIFHLYGELPPSLPIVTIFGKFSGLADVIKSAKIQNDRSRGFLFGGYLKMACSHRKFKSSLTLSLPWYELRLTQNLILLCCIIRVSSILNVAAKWSLDNIDMASVVRTFPGC
jgi:hypothetical protein